MRNVGFAFEKADPFEECFYSTMEHILICWFIKHLLYKFTLISFIILLEILSELKNFYILNFLHIFHMMKFEYDQVIRYKSNKQHFYELQHLFFFFWRCNKNVFNFFERIGSINYVKRIFQAIYSWTCDSTTIIKINLIIYSKLCRFLILES